MINDDMDPPRQQSTFQCDICDYAVESAAGLQKHIDKEHNRTSMSCPHCGYSVKSERMLNNHVKQEHPNLFQLGGGP